MKPIFKNQRGGFSLIEVIIVVAVAASVVVVVSNFGTNISGINGLITNELKSKSDIAQTLEIMSNEIRGAEPSAAGAYAINAAASSSFTFYDSVHANGVIDQVTYYLASSTIWRVLIAPTGTPATYPTSSEIVNDMIDNVSLVSSSTPLFSYYPATYIGSGSPLSSPVAVASIRLVDITFSSQVNTNPSQPESPQYFSQLVDIRNLDSN
jgi:prepilin-type N-terminal cleavage/methylation domain-containing protein